MASRETQPVQRKSADERKELLAHTVENEVAHGSRVESQSDFQAVLVRGRRPNFVERLILKIAFLGWSSWSVPSESPAAGCGEWWGPWPSSS
jgi:hypothetical protein